jgi:exodeoxyribonuclease V alpha subunit
MNQTLPITDFLRDLFPEATEDLLRLLSSAQANANLVDADFYTLRDLLELSGYESEEPVLVLLLALLVALEEGSLCVEASVAGLSRRLAGLAEDAVLSESQIRTWATLAVARLEKDDLPALVGRLAAMPGRAALRPVLLLEQTDRRYLYFQKYLHHELNLAEILKKRLAAEPASLHGRRTDVLHEVLDENPLRMGGQPIRLNPAQRTALELVLERDLVIVSGGPGTGKTSIVVNVLRCLVRSGIAAEKMALAAPTGRAAQRLTEALRTGLNSLDQIAEPDRQLQELTAVTLHQLLRYRPGQGTFRHHAENPLPAEIVIVDEVSMVGVLLMAQLFQALRPQTRILLLGDKDQLSSVNPGAVLANLTATETLPVLVVLKGNYRSQSQIQEAAGAINAQDGQIAQRLPRFSLGGINRGVSKATPAAPVRSFADLAQQGGCWLLDQANGELAAWRSILEQWAEWQYGARTVGEDYASLLDQASITATGGCTEAKEVLDRLFAIVNGNRILTLVREGAWGCEGINRFLGQCLVRRLDLAGEDSLFAGLPMLITRNDYARQLFNGDVGVTVRGPGGYWVIFQRGGGYQAFPVHVLPAHEPAFALTVHKSQGSEYQEVLLVLPPEGGKRMLTKEIVYTGITRARQLAVVCGSPERLHQAIMRKFERASPLLRFGFNVPLI